MFWRATCSDSLTQGQKRLQNVAENFEIISV